MDLNCCDMQSGFTGKYVTFFAVFSKCKENMTCCLTLEVVTCGSCVSRLVKYAVNATGVATFPRTEIYCIEDYYATALGIMEIISYLNAI